MEERKILKIKIWKEYNNLLKRILYYESIAFEGSPKHNLDFPDLMWQFKLTFPSMKEVDEYSERLENYIGQLEKEHERIQKQKEYENKI